MYVENPKERLKNHGLTQFSLYYVWKETNFLQPGYFSFLPTLYSLLKT